MEAFVVENLMNKAVTINCGNGDLFSGVIVDCINKVITLKRDDGNIYINLDKVISIRENKR